MIDLSKINQDWGFNPQTNDWSKKSTTPQKYVYGQNPALTGGSTVPATTGGTTNPTYDFGEYDPYSSWSPDDAFKQKYGAQGNLYNITEDRWMNSGDPAAGNIKQNWWRNDQWADPNNPNGDGMVYNSYWGFQPYEDVAANYRSASAPVSWDDFQNWGMTQNPNWDVNWWQGDGGGTDGGGHGSEVDFASNMGEDWQNYFDNGGVQNTTQYPTEAWDASSLVTPSQWDTATNVATNYAYGYPTQSPWEWDAAAQATTNQPWYDAMKGVVETNTSDAIKQAAEQAGLGGMRWSTPMGRTAQDIAGRNQAQLGTTWAGMESAAKEAAQGRLMQTGTNKAGLQESARDRALQASGLLSTLGGQTTDYARGVASDLMSGGSTMAGQSNQEAQNIYNQFLKSTPEGNPWLQAALGIGSASGTPTTYDQSGGTSLLSGIGSLASLMALKGK
jgi:hypothetical protein